MEIQFLGAADTVTGSRYLVRSGPRTVLVDCGLFQGLKKLRLRNWQPFPVDPKEIDAVVLTHAHLDHSGYLPRLIQEGFAGSVYCTPGTRTLCEILLPDSGYLQEEEASYANRRGFSKHRPALPLYTWRDAVLALERFYPISFGRDFDLGGGITFRLLPAGHIPGAAMVLLRAGSTSILFSGDLGRPRDPLLPAPTAVERADYLVVESTYGDRLHPAVDPADQLAAVVTRTVNRGGTVIIPAFAVGRTQVLLYYIHRLKRENRIPDVPVYLDSPMAVEATRAFRDLAAEHRLSEAECEAVCSAAKLVGSVEESKALDRMQFPFILLSASGMLAGGRVLHHLKALAPDHRNTIVLAGHQAAGSRGAALLAGAKSLKIHGGYVDIQAEVAVVDSLSAHADYAEILEWLEGFAAPPRQTFITHGEPTAADALRHRIEERLGWSCRVPEHEERVNLS